MKEDKQLLLENQSITLGRIDSIIDPLVVSLDSADQSEPKSFIFSLESAIDSNGSDEDSGAYNMNVN